MLIFHINLNKNNYNFRAGPVKTFECARNKCENDYFSEIWPTSDYILDLDRCSIVYKNINHFNLSLNEFITKNKKNIIRIKNGWINYDINNETKYSDFNKNKISIIAIIRIIIYGFMVIIMH